MNYLIFIATWPVRSYNGWRINRWWNLRREGVENQEALRRAWLRPEKALSILEGTLDFYLGTVSVLSFSGGRFKSSMNDVQLALVMQMMAELSPALPETKRQEVRDRIRELANHDWGYVRRATVPALDRLKLQQT